MNILFICGSIEPGKDGVGDYTRRLSGALIRLGYQAVILATHDSAVTKCQKETQNIDSTDIIVLRIPKFFKVFDRMQIIKTFIKDFNPQCISLQFVLFSFNDKGLPISFAYELKKAAMGRKWHVMFHELWVGMNKETTVKLFIVGVIQKQLIGRLLRLLKPEVIHTQTGLYQVQLLKMGYRAILLPLISNIPISHFRNSSSVSSAETDEISFVFFGSIFPGAPFEEFTKEAIKYFSLTGKKGFLNLIGRNGPEQDRWISIWKGNGLSIRIWGEQPAEQISAILSTASYGLSTTPVELAEKSGSIMAMREHGLNVISIFTPWSPLVRKKIELLEGVFKYIPGNLNDVLADNVKSESKLNSLSSVTSQYENDLSPYFR